MKRWSVASGRKSVDGPQGRAVKRAERWPADGLGDRDELRGGGKRKHSSNLQRRRIGASELGCPQRGASPLGLARDHNASGPTYAGKLADRTNAVEDRVALGDAVVRGRWARGTESLVVGRDERDA